MVGATLADNELMAANDSRMLDAGGQAKGETVETQPADVRNGFRAADGRRMGGERWMIQSTIRPSSASEHHDRHRAPVAGKRQPCRICSVRKKFSRRQQRKAANCQPPRPKVTA